MTKRKETNDNDLQNTMPKTRVRTALLKTEGEIIVTQQYKITQDYWIGNCLPFGNT